MAPLWTLHIENIFICIPPAPCTVKRHLAVKAVTTRIDTTAITQPETGQIIENG
jgi:hypothetical protein